MIFKNVSVKASGAERYLRGVSADIAVNGVTHRFVRGIYVGTSASGDSNAPFEI